VTVDNVSTPIYFIALHTKSKYVQQGQQMWNYRNPATQMEYIKKSVANRRRIAAECIRTRKCIDDIIFGDTEKDAFVLVAGDFNDGPGMDFFEEYYLLGDSVESLMGSVFQKKKLLAAAILEHAPLHHRYTCVFDDFVDDVKEKKVLLDQIFISQSLDKLIVQCGIAHDIFNKYSAPPEKIQHKRDDHPSDHRPVFGDFAITLESGTSTKSSTSSALSSTASTSTSTTTTTPTTTTPVPAPAKPATAGEKSASS